MHCKEPDSDGIYRHSIWFANILEGSNGWFPPIEVKFYASTLEGLMCRRQEIFKQRLLNYRSNSV